LADNCPSRADTSGEEERIRKSCEFIFENAQNHQTSAFSYINDKNGGGTMKRSFIASQQMVWILNKLDI
jgi:hypothetical protein